MSTYEDPEGHTEHESREVGKKEGSRFLIHRGVLGRTLEFGFFYQLTGSIPKTFICNNNNTNCFSYFFFNII